MIPDPDDCPYLLVPEDVHAELRRTQRLGDVDAYRRAAEGILRCERGRHDDNRHQHGDTEWRDPSPEPTLDLDLIDRITQLANVVVGPVADAIDDPPLACTRCDETLCTVEAGDELLVLIRTAAAHRCPAVDQ